MTSAIATAPASEDYGEAAELRFWAPSELPEVTVGQRFEFAIQLPDGTLWRDWSAKAKEPDSDAPTVYPTEARATVARDDLVGIVEDTYGAVHYLPRVVARIVQSATGPWGAPEGAK